MADKAVEKWGSMEIPVSGYESKEAEVDEFLRIFPVCEATRIAGFDKPELATMIAAGARLAAVKESASNLLRVSENSAV